MGGCHGGCGRETDLQRVGRKYAAWMCLEFTPVPGRTLRLHLSFRGTLGRTLKVVRKQSPRQPHNKYFPNNITTDHRNRRLALFGGGGEALLTFQKQTAFLLNWCFWKGFFEFQILILFTSHAPVSLHHAFNFLQVPDGESFLIHSRQPNELSWKEMCQNRAVSQILIKKKKPQRQKTRRWCSAHPESDWVEISERDRGALQRRREQEDWITPTGDWRRWSGGVEWKARRKKNNWVRRISVRARWEDWTLRHRWEDALSTPATSVTHSLCILGGMVGPSGLSLYLLAVWRLFCQSSRRLMVGLLPYVQHYVREGVCFSLCSPCCRRYYRLYLIIATCCSCQNTRGAGHQPLRGHPEAIKRLQDAAIQGFFWVLPEPGFWLL